MSRRHKLHGLAAALLIAGGGLFIFTETVAPAVAGLACTVLAGVMLLLARDRASADKHE
ncbi:MAG: hypothetical protein QF578_04715 [Alphaproteobacteria bacterium]|jgi:hypothetical protein|nr:hypothetical protein [Alphaproteobacteria bacterium]MDP6564106.1 hypothetical protein [Alphaproteobacteria bacterium]MDP6814741.1 hypothetical protein [Alphaproteobacteria bacterium]